MLPKPRVYCGGDISTHFRSILPIFSQTTLRTANIGERVFGKGLKSEVPSADLYAVGSVRHFIQIVYSDWRSFYFKYCSFVKYLLSILFMVQLAAVYFIEEKKNLIDLVFSCGYHQKPGVNHMVIVHG